MCEEQLDEAGQQRLEEMLTTSEEAQWLYIFEMNLHANLVLDHRNEPNETETAEALAVPSLPPLPAALPALSPSSFFGDVWHGTASFFSEGWPSAYLLGTIIFGTGLGICALITVTHQVQVAQKFSLPAPSLPESLPASVGRITGMVACRWSKDSLAPRGYDNVLVGRQFKLDSGPLELTYDTGAKVILQGPATYQVDAKDGGFLAIGKLTAQVEKRDEGRGARGEQIINQKS